MDTAVDPLLAEGDPRRGTTANAQAARAYELFRDRVAERPRARASLAAGAQVQRPLWASTSTKNPAYCDLLYVETPRRGRDGQHDARRDAARDARPRGLRLVAAVEPGRDRVRRPRGSTSCPSDVDLDAVTAQLEVDGVAAFVASYEELLTTIATKLGRASQ